MRKIIVLFLSLAFLVSSFLTPEKAYAGSCYTPSPDPGIDGFSNTITVKGNLPEDLPERDNSGQQIVYSIWVRKPHVKIGPLDIWDHDEKIADNLAISNGALIFELSNSLPEENKAGSHTIYIQNQKGQRYCGEVKYETRRFGTACKVTLEPGVPGLGDSATIKIENLSDDLGRLNNSNSNFAGFLVELKAAAGKDPKQPNNGRTTVQGNTLIAQISEFQYAGTHTGVLKSFERQAGAVAVESACSFSFLVRATPGQREPKVLTDKSSSLRREQPQIEPFRLSYCNPETGQPANNAEAGGIQTGLGCIPFNANSFASWFLSWAIGIAGGVAFILMLVAGLQIATSSGNPEKVQGGKELLTSAISGLILILFSVFLLKLIGVDILGLGQFGF